MNSMNHMFLNDEKYKIPKLLEDNYEVVEYEMVEKRKMNFSELLKERFSNRDIKIY